MGKIFNCRRYIIALVAICCLTGMGVYIGTDIGAISVPI